MTLQTKRKRLSYGEQIAVMDEILERIEKGLDSFKEELKEEIKDIHESFVRKSDFDHKFEDMNTNVQNLEKKVDTGFKSIEEKLSDGKKITEWLRKNFFILVGVGMTILYFIDHIEALKNFIKL